MYLVIAILFLFFLESEEVLEKEIDGSAGKRIVTPSRIVLESKRSPISFKKHASVINSQVRTYTEHKRYNMDANICPSFNNPTTIFH